MMPLYSILSLLVFLNSLRLTLDLFALIYKALIILYYFWGWVYNLNIQKYPDMHISILLEKHFKLFEINQLIKINNAVSKR